MADRKKTGYRQQETEDAQHQPQRKAMKETPKQRANQPMLTWRQNDDVERTMADLVEAFRRHGIDIFIEAKRQIEDGQVFWSMQLGLAENEPAEIKARREEFKAWRERKRQRTLTEIDAEYFSRLARAMGIIRQHRPEAYAKIAAQIQTLAQRPDEPTTTEAPCPHTKEKQ